MSRVNKLHQWKERLRDRARTVSFGRFLWRRFLDDRLFQAAASLAYTTVFAPVPLAIVVFGVLSAFPAFNEWKDALTDFIFNNFVLARRVRCRTISTVRWRTWASSPWPVWSRWWPRC